MNKENEVKIVGDAGNRPALSATSPRRSASGLFAAIAIAVLMTGCADREIVTACVDGHTYGFWGGLWHGMISPFDFIGMLIWDDVTVYAENNNGALYAFGFVLGVGGFAGSARWSSK